MVDTADYEAFAAKHPPDTEVQVELVSKDSGFDVKVAGTELKGRIARSEIALDPDDRDLAKKYAEPGERMRAFVVRVDLERQQIGFTLIDPATDPWRAHAAELHLGAELEGKVVERHMRGYDVELFEGVVALMKKDEVSWDGEAALDEGESVEIVVIRDPSGGHAMEVSARRRTPRPGRFQDELVSDWERALPPDASFDEELRFRRKLAIDLRSAGLAMDEAVDADAPRETLLVLRDDSAMAVRLVAIAHESLDGAALEALSMGTVTISDLGGPGALDDGERASSARVLAMADALDMFPWSADAWVEGVDEAPTVAELEALAESTTARELYFDGAGSPSGRVDGRIVAVTEITRVPD